MRLNHNVFKTYSSLSLVKKSMIWYTAATILQKGISFLTTPIYTRMLTDSQYGLYSVYQSWLQIISVISVVALDRCVTVGFMKYDNDRKGFLSSIQFLMTLTAAAFLGIVIIFHSFFSALLGFPLIIIVTIFAVALLSNVMSNWSWYLRYEYQYKKLAICTIIFTVITQAGSIAAVYFTPFKNKGFVLIISSSLLTFALYGVIYIIVFQKGKTLYHKDYWKFALPYSVAVVPHALAQIILNSSDRIMIDKLCGREDAAYYGVTYSAAMVLNIIILSVSSAMQPWFFEKIKSRDFKAVREKTNSFLLLSAVLSILVSLVAPEILSILAPDTYKDAIWIFPSVAASVFFNSMYLCFANFESFFEKSVYFSIATITGAIVNIVLNFILIPVFGFVAAGYTTFLCYIIFAVMHYIFMRKVCNEKLNGTKIFNMKFIIILSIVVVLFSIGLTVTYAFFALRYCLLMIGIIICIIKRKFLVAFMNKKEDGF